MTYRIYIQSPRYGSCDELCGCSYKLARPYTYETLECALAFRTLVWKELQAEYGDYAYDLGVVVLDEKGRERFGKVNFATVVDDEIPF